MNIYVGNFSYEITGDDLKEVFGAFGYVESAKVIRDNTTGDSRGFGFVDMPNNKEAQTAIESITEIKGRRVTINEAFPQEKRPSFSGHKRGQNGRKSGRRERRY